MAAVLARSPQLERRAIVLSAPTPILRPVHSNEVCRQVLNTKDDFGFGSFVLLQAERKGLPRQAARMINYREEPEVAALPLNAEAGPSRIRTRAEDEDANMTVDAETAEGEELYHSANTVRKKQHKCNIDGCGKTFKKAAKLTDHQLSHTEERPHQCPHCPSRYKKPTHLSAHIRTHLSSESRTFVCCRFSKAIAFPRGADQEARSRLGEGRHEQDGGYEPVRASDGEGSICGKRFWTGQHLKRHEETCGLGRHTVISGKGLQTNVVEELQTGGQDPKSTPSLPGYTCPDCSLHFRKHRLLQTHYTETHAGSHTAFDDPDGPGTSTSVKGRNAVKLLIPVGKKYKCNFEGCEWNFETRQKLDGHLKTHDASRYVCGHSGHMGVVGRPKFRTWTDLQKHMKLSHPPCCPYPECEKRQFTRQSNLKEHLRIHSERGESLTAAQVGPRATGLPNDASALDDAVSDEVVLDMTSRKRKRAESVGGPSPNRRLRRASSVYISIAKEWICEESDCPKSFQTESALKKHNATAHLGLRPFACSDVGCDRSYGHRHLLQRHIAAKHRVHPDKEGISGSSHSQLLPTQPQPRVGSHDSDVKSSALDRLSGASRHVTSSITGRQLGCPVETEGQDIFRCGHKCLRIYDLQRHIKKEHDLDLDEVEIRILLQQKDGYRL